MLDLPNKALSVVLLSILRCAAVTLVALANITVSAEEPKAGRILVIGSIDHEQGFVRGFGDLTARNTFHFFELRHQI